MKAANRPYARNVKQLTSAEARFHAPKAGKVHAQRQKVCIEGEYVDAIQIAERIGVHHQTAWKRLAALRKKDGPITWSALSETQR